MEDILPSEHKAWLQARAISGNTFDCCNKFKVSILYPHTILLIPSKQISSAIKLPTPTKLNPLSIHVVHVLQGYIILL